MSDFFISMGRDAPLDTISSQMSWGPNARVWKGTCHSINWLVTQVSHPELWAPAYDATSGIRVLVAGRFAFDEAEWSRAERLNHQGGLAARLILEDWTSGNRGALRSLNGGGVAIVIDEKSGSVDLFTDRLGFYPAFFWSGHGQIFCSHPDVLANTLELQHERCSLDTLSLAEFLKTGSATHPHTLWNEISQLDAGCRYYVSGDCGYVEQSRAAGPCSGRTISDTLEATDRIEHALRQAVQRRTSKRLGSQALLLSAGADSRAILFGAEDPSSLTCYTLYDEPNAELEGAAALASLAGAKHVTFKRDQEYYLRHASEAVRLSGGMWSIESAHFLGLFPLFDSAEYGTVLTGCYADYLFKGLGINRRPVSFLGKNLPLYRPGPISAEWYLPHFPIAPEYERRILEERISAAPLSSSNGGDKRINELQYSRIVPLSREGDASGRMALRHRSPLDIVLADNELVDLFTNLSPSIKTAGIAFGKAVGRIQPREANQVLNNNYSAPVASGAIARTLLFSLNSVRRKLQGTRALHPFQKNARSVATHGSWPHFPRIIANSPSLASWWDETPKPEAELLQSLLGFAPLAPTSWPPERSSLFLRYFTASLWLTQNPLALRG